MSAVLLQTGVEGPPRADDDRAAFLPSAAIEQAAYTHPWTVANFTDSLAAGYHCQCLMGPAPDDGTPHRTPRGVAWRCGAAPLFRTVDETIIGYFRCHERRRRGPSAQHHSHPPRFKRQGWAPLMLEALAWLVGAGLSAQWLWLEVRASQCGAPRSPSMNATAFPPRRHPQGLLPGATSNGPARMPW